MMPKFIIEKPENLRGTKAIQPLSTVIEQLGLKNVLFWSLRQITFMCDSLPFDISALDIEKMSRQMKRGFIMADEDFRAFLEAGIQIIDGLVDGYADDCQNPLFQIECVDSTLWLISTSSTKLGNDLLDHFHFRLAVPAMSDIRGAFLLCKSLEQCADGVP